VNVVDEALKTALDGADLGAATGVCNTLAPPKQAFPYVVFALVSAITEDSNTADGLRLQYDVKAVSKDASPAAAGAIADLIDAALHGQSLTITGWICVQVRRVARLKVHDGECWHVGGTYEILIQEV
jgi:hypothetical protein